MFTLVVFLLLLGSAGYALNLQSKLRRISVLLAQLQARVAKLEASRNTSTGETLGADLTPPASVSSSAEQAEVSPRGTVDTSRTQPVAMAGTVIEERKQPERAVAPKHASELFVLPPIATQLWTVLKQNSFAAVGVGLVLLGCSFLFPMLVLHGLFPPALRLALAASVGISLMAVGFRLSKRKPDYAHVLQGGGAAVLYLTTYAAMAFYALIATWPAFAIFVALSAIIVGLSHQQAAKPLSFLGFTGAYLAPVLTVRGTAHLDVVLIYGLLVNGASLYVGLRQRWIEMSLQAFVWSLLLAFGAYTGNAPALPPWIQQAFLTAYFALFASYPLLHANRWDSTPVDAFSLQTMTGLLTPVALSLEYWIGGRTGLAVAASLAALGHLGLYFIPRKNAAGFYTVHAVLAILSAMAAIFAPGLSSALTAMLAGAVAVCAYLSLPGRLRWLSAVPGAAAISVGLSPLHAPAALVACALALGVGYLAVIRRHVGDAWVVHALSAFLSLVAGYALFHEEPDGSMFAYTLPATLAIAAGLGWVYRRAGNFSALACHSAATATVLVLSLLASPVGVTAEIVQVIGLVAACALAGVLVHVYEARLVPNSRLVFVIAAPIVLGALAHQHVPMRHSFANECALGGWVVLSIAAVLDSSRLRLWIPDTPALRPVRNVVTRFVLPLIFSVQWIHSVIFKTYPDSAALQALWMTLSIVLVAHAAAWQFVRTVVAGGIALLLAYLLGLADLRAAITLAWAVTALTALVVGSRVNDRALWVVGATISALVVTKLILLDMSTSSPIWRVLSFIGSGLLFVLAGYVAPAPAKGDDAGTAAGGE